MVMEEKRKIALGIGGIHVDKAPCTIVTYLGSCVAVCFYVPREKVGGMIHVASAEAPKTSQREDSRKGKYADTAVAELLDQLRRNYKVTGRQVVAKVFGGAKILQQVTRNIGQENEAAVMQVLEQLKISVAASQTGGDKGYRIEFDLDSGAVFCQSFGGQLKEY